MQIETKKTVASKAMPGVSFVVRRLSKLRRARRDFGVMATQIRIAQLVDQEKEILRQLGAKPDDAQQAAVKPALLALQYEVDLLIDRDLKPASIREALVAIEGLASEDGPVTSAEQLLALGTPETDALADEIFEACETASGLSGEQEKNSASPTISPVAVVSELPATEPVAAG